MEGEGNGLWGPSHTLGTNASTPLGFEDSFAPQDSHEGNAATTSPAETYVPLDDSQQYLTGLESKLARLQGRTSSSRQSESRRLLDALAGSRSSHCTQLMQSSQPLTEDLPTMDPAHLSTTSSSIPQGALGTMLRRVAPDRVALTPEELSHLLRADLLDQMYESDGTQHPPVVPACSTDAQEQTSCGLPVVGDPRESSSDEGEK